jgi:hypothetical protein
MAKNYRVAAQRCSSENRRFLGQVPNFMRTDMLRQNSSRVSLQTLAAR